MPFIPDIPSSIQLAAFAIAVVTYASLLLYSSKGSRQGILKEMKKLGGVAVIGICFVLWLFLILPVVFGAYVIYSDAQILAAGQHLPPHVPISQMPTIPVDISLSSVALALAIYLLARKRFLEKFPKGILAEVIYFLVLLVLAWLVVSIAWYAINYGFRATAHYFGELP